MVHLLRSFRDDVSMRRARAWWRMLVIFSVVKVSAFIAMGVLVWLAFAQTAPGALTGFGASSRLNLLSSGFDALLWLQMVDFLAGILSVGPSSWSAAVAPYGQTLMNAVVARDAQVTREVVVLPPGSAGEGAQAIEGARTLGPLSHPMRALALNQVTYLFGVLGGFALVGMGTFMTISSLRIPPSFHPPITLANWITWLNFPACLILLGMAGVAAALVAGRFARMERLDITAHVDASGLTFARAGAARQGRRLAWSDMRGFARFAFTDELGRLHEVFALRGPNEDLLWEALYDVQSASAATASDEARRVAAHQLTEQVTLRSGLPLLDLTPPLAATLAASPVAFPYALGGLFARARIIARRQGDAALADAITQRQAQGGKLLGRVRVRLGNGVRRLSPDQREETLRLARELLPYYPTPAQVASTIPGQRRARQYWLSEYALQALVIILSCANFLLAVFWPFA